MSCILKFTHTKLSWALNNQLEEVLEVWLYLNFTMTYVPAEHWQNTGYIFLLKYICVFSKYSTFKNKQSILLKYILISLWPSNWRRIIFTIINFLNLLKFGKHKTINKTLFNHFPTFWVMDSLRATYLARTGKFWARSPFRSLARSTLFCVCIGR
jgi:hypothetical protein